MTFAPVFCSNAFRTLRKFASSWPVHLAATSIVVPFSAPPPAGVEPSLPPSSSPPHAAADYGSSPAATGAPLSLLTLIPHPP